ncbi:MAG TPA: sugar transferase [Tenuifilaceae bacterium]|jgi:lipopolysaccharide/colanic/teichoic acid biosynthesis glycosyltransferase|nr:sugar transferase [Bacteroidales bacterium]MDI9517148.1 sugar transferase [Bacteroidota bacterium]NLH55349.1 sugar transferase [Rikenellaceae bacterium]OQC65132.1 MAG: putative sugar transferase EpsL [Bacteroidetes bacterium ADurb.Bin008]HNV80621.1 sugar transferase [Tenuifilaceae bacterium]
MSKRATLIVIDFLLLFAAFCIINLIRLRSVGSAIEAYKLSFLVFAAIWIAVSLSFGKYGTEGTDFQPKFKKIIVSNLVALAIATWLMFLFYFYNLSRVVVFGTIGIATLLEIMMLGTWYLVKQSKILPEEKIKKKKLKPIEELHVEVDTSRTISDERRKAVKRAIINELGENVYKYFNTNLNLSLESTLIISTTTVFNIDNQPSNFFHTIANLKRVNDIRWINKFFESVNAKLPKGGFFVCMAETKNLRKARILKKYPPVINYIVYSIDFIIKRILPKFTLTKGIYFFLTRGQNRVITRAEVLGRLYSCGFEVVDEQFIDNHLYVISRKIKQPAYDLEATYGPLVKLRRIGKGGKEIKVYKMRTMHPYAEYLQEYIYQKHSLDEGGKFKDDFRVSTLGRIMRRLWIDELPMLINLFRGELKIVGVRPLSKQYFSLYTTELQEKRIKTKPGLIPPFYVDKPETLEGIMASEHKYLDAYFKHPFLTDFKYFFKAVYNIVVKRYRSR